MRPARCVRAVHPGRADRLTIAAAYARIPAPGVLRPDSRARFPRAIPAPGCSARLPAPAGAPDSRARSPASRVLGHTCRGRGTGRDVGRLCPDGGSAVPRVTGDQED
ncbi:hypothetical protein GCM10010193_18670 [Kitasatospora atroaurantiaca]